MRQWAVKSQTALWRWLKQEGMMLKEPETQAAHSDKRNLFSS
jgi:transposase